jgi:hypothetical protein
VAKDLETKPSGTPTKHFPLHEDAMREKFAS